MKQVININFQGRVVPIEQTAYDVLKQYIESLHRFFAREEGKDEIVNDIENRIGELFQQKLKDGSSCITDADVDAVIRSVGRPEDFEAAELGTAPAGEETTSGASTGKTSYTYTRGQRLYRDENDKVLGGVCSGLAHYFNIDVVVVRVIFAILFFSAGIGFIPYIILWVVVPSTASMQIGSVRKRLFRDMDNKYVGGVCSGLANYFGIKVWIPRVLFLLPLISFVSKWNWGNWGLPEVLRFGFSPTAVLIYIILWLILPEAKTTSEKLEMKGEKVDLDSIKNSVKQEFRGVQERANKFSEEARQAFTSKGAYSQTNMTEKSRSAANSLSKFISLVVKIILYAIAGSLIIALLVALFALAIFSVGIFPLKDFVLTGGWQDVWAWGTLIFFIAVPVIGVITWLVRKFAKIRSNSMIMRGGFIGLWIVGWFCASMLLAGVFNNFRVENRPQAEEIYLNNPNVNKLELTTNSPEFEYNIPSTFTFEPFDWVEDDTAFVHNVHINILKAKNDSFRVVEYRSARGASREQANANADLIDFRTRQVDSLLVLDRGVRINKYDKFRNQEVTLNVYVPVGKKIRINENTNNWRSVKINGFNIRYNDHEYENTMQGWTTNEDYTMQEDGLYGEDGLPADSRKLRERYERQGDGDGLRIETRDGKQVIVDDNGIIIRDSDSRDGYRYRQNQDTTPKTIPAIDEEKKRKKDSLQKELDKTKKELDGLSAKAALPITNLFIMPGYNPALLMN